MSGLTEVIAKTQMSSTTSRIRRWWTEEEDQILRKEAEYQLSLGNLNDWSRIAAKLPGRTNKDCRKRWSKIPGHIKKGVWSEAEDQRLKSAVKTLDGRWTDVAQSVGTRNADQCAKRWHHSLDPNLDHSEWIPEDDARLLAAVASHGRVWKTIGEREFPGRSATELKNRFVTINRKRQQKQSAANSVSGSSTSPSTTNNISSSNVDVDLDLDVEDSGSSPPTSLSDNAEFPDKEFDSDILRPAYSPMDFSALPSHTSTPPLPTHPFRTPEVSSYVPSERLSCPSLSRECSFNLIDDFSSHQHSNPTGIFGANNSFFNTGPSGNVTLELEQSEAQRDPLNLAWNQSGSPLSTLAAKAKEEGSTLVLEDVQPAMVTRILSLLYEKRSPVKKKIVSQDQDRAMQWSNNLGWE